MNIELLVSDTRHYRIDCDINPYMCTATQPDPASAAAEHAAIVAAHRAAGRIVHHIPAALECPDMGYTVNAALVRGDRAVLGSPPGPRQREIPYFRAWLLAQGYEVLDAPYPFSGQGDALPCGELLLAGYGQRTDRRMHAVVGDHLHYRTVALRTSGPHWYEIDLAVAVIENPHTLAYCPDALDRLSRHALRDLGLDLIEVCVEEAARFALNLVSDAATVTMTNDTPRLAAQLRERGLQVTELDTTELRTGGGGVRCTASTLDSLRPPTRR